MISNCYEDTAMLAASARHAQFSRSLSSTQTKYGRRISSGGEIVAMMQAAEPWHRDDLATCTMIRFCFTSGRRSLGQRKMRSILMIVPDVLVHQAFQMPLIENDYVVKQIAAAVADPSLGNTVLPRTSEAGPLGLNAEALYGVNHLCIELCAPIKDQVAGR